MFIEYPATLNTLRGIVEKYAARSNGSFYAVSQQRLMQRLTLWGSSLPRVKPYYAVKCNPEPLLLDWMKRANVGFDCASAREIRIAPPGADIIYANPCKKEDDILHALGVDTVTTTVVDSVEEVEKLGALGWNKKALVRIMVEDSGSLMPFSSKFGADPAIFPEIVRAATSRGIEVTGISFHVGSGCKNPWQYTAAINSAHTLLPLLKTPTPIVDIGGGFTADGFANAATHIRNAMKKSGVTYIAEPGRLFAGPTHDLFTRVIGKKPAHRGLGWRYTIDESLYGQFSCIPFDQATPKWVRVRGSDESQRSRTPAVIFGRTCDSVDRIAKADGAEELEIGDWLWWPNMGAYTTVTATEFNGFPRPPTFVCEDLPTPTLGPMDIPSSVSYVSHVTL